ncbi:helix-turn-helix domain-containing protein [Sinomonas atrocyanea]
MLHRRASRGPGALPRPDRRRGRHQRTPPRPGLHRGGRAAGRLRAAAPARTGRGAPRRPGEGTTPIAAIAARCGFSSQAYFARAFRARFGTTPREARRDRGAAVPVRPA